MNDSKIEWTDATFNPWWGCTKVSQGCKNCYAETLASRYQKDCWGPKGIRRSMSENYWNQPHKWNRDAEKSGKRKRVFCASMADVFEGPETMPDESVAMVNTARVRLAGLILATPWLDWQILTKRPENVVKMWAYARGHVDGERDFPPNMWIGTSVEDQEAADARIIHLLKIPAAVRFLSCEPLIGPVDLCGGCPGCPTDCGWMPGKNGWGIHWVIGGGESGPGKRPMELEWMRSLRDQCKAAGVPFFGKQWDKVQPLPVDLMVREFPLPVAEGDVQ